MFRYEVIVKENCGMFGHTLVVKETKMKDEHQSEMKLLEWCEQKYGKRFVGLRVLPAWTAPR